MTIQRKTCTKKGNNSKMTSLHAPLTDVLFVITFRIRTRILKTLVLCAILKNVYYNLFLFSKGKHSSKIHFQEEKASK